MLNESNQVPVKTLTKELGTTQASLINALVGYALDNLDECIDVVRDSVEPAQKRGRKPKTQETVTVVEETFEDEGTTELEEVVNAPFTATA